MKYLTEDMLREDFIEWLNSNNETKVYAKEVQIFGAGTFSIDLVYLDKERKFICVELKLTDWKKVVEQALNVKKHTPFIYVAMPLPATIKKRDAIEKICKEKGLGLYWYNKSGLWTCQLTPIERMVQSYREDHIKYFDRRLEQNLYLHYHFTFMAPLLGKAAEVSRNYEYKTKNVIW